MSKEEPKKGKKGGKRPGAGRPKRGKIEEMTFTTQKKDIKVLHKIQELSGETLRNIFRRAVIAEYLKTCEEYKVKPEEIE
jgi:hypothetical protein